MLLLSCMNNTDSENISNYDILIAYNNEDTSSKKRYLRNMLASSLHSKLKLPKDYRISIKYRYDIDNLVQRESLEYNFVLIRSYIDYTLYYQDQKIDSKNSLMASSSFTNNSLNLNNNLLHMKTRHQQNISQLTDIIVKHVKDQILSH